MTAATDLTAASWRAFSTLLDRALELPPPERIAWLDTLGAEHAALKPALRAVLERGAGVETLQWLDTLPRGDGPAPPLEEPELQPDARVGPYRLLRELGVGGMGAVWLAERADGTLKRQVALKLPRAVWSAWLAQRMARERDILASLEHPNIARLYDAGTDAQGRPVPRPRIRRGSADRCLLPRTCAGCTRAGHVAAAGGACRRIRAQPACNPPRSEAFQHSGNWRTAKCGCSTSASRS